MILVWSKANKVFIQVKQGVEKGVEQETDSDRVRRGVVVAS